MRLGGKLARDMELEGGQLSQINVTVDGMFECQSIQQSAGAFGILSANHEWSLEPAKEQALVMQRETYLGVGVLFYDFACVELLYAQGFKPRSDTYRCSSGL